MNNRDYIPNNDAAFDNWFKALVFVAQSPYTGRQNVVCLVTLYEIWS
ncbi:MAG: hypothetical protein LBC60_01070 [Spirochaetaceae bacterium]|jgi:hypothetical protein|nr:hypothetical protein [Spirochaetaceae bacterium]